MRTGSVERAWRASAANKGSRLGAKQLPGRALAAIEGGRHSVTIGKGGTVPTHSPSQVASAQRRSTDRCGLRSSPLSSGLGAGLVVLQVSMMNQAPTSSPEAVTSSAVVKIVLTPSLLNSYPKVPAATMTSFPIHDPSQSKLTGGNTFRHKLEGGHVPPGLKRGGMFRACGRVAGP